MTIKVFNWHVDPLREVLKRRKTLPHAFLIHGKEGIGKVEFARALAQSLLCESYDDSGIACGQCPACHWFVEGNHPDFREVIPAALLPDSAEEESVASESAKAEKKSMHITIDQIRELGAMVALSSHRDGFRVLLIHPAEAMNPAAANALLKTLEEPTPGVVILLIANQPGRLLATVNSRCQKLAVPAPAPAEALAWLKAAGVSEPEIVLAQAGGAPLLALDYADIEYQNQRKTLLRALGDPARSDWLSMAASLEKSNLDHVVHWLQTWCCDLIYQKSTSQIRHHPDFKPALEQVAKGAALIALFRYESQLRSARRTIGHPLSARLLLEQLLLSYADAVNSPSS